MKIIPAPVVGTLGRDAKVTVAVSGSGGRPLPNPSRLPRMAAVTTTCADCGEPREARATRCRRCSANTRRLDVGREQRIRRACPKPSGLTDREHERHIQLILGKVWEAEHRTGLTEREALLPEVRVAPALSGPVAGEKPRAGKGTHSRSVSSAGLAGRETRPGVAADGSRPASSVKANDRARRALSTNGASGPTGGDSR